jgi:ferrochelatase
MPVEVTTGVLLLAHGTVSDVADLPAFLARIRHGRPPPSGFVEELSERYQAVGGSPLLELTRSQGAALSARLGLPVLVGMRLWDPSVESAIETACEMGLTKLCAVPLAPYSVHVYDAAARRSLEAVCAKRVGQVPELVCVPPYGSVEGYVSAQCERIRPVLTAHPDASLILTAHSLPTIAIERGDPYGQQTAESAACIGAALGRPYRLAYQSQGADGDGWLGPDLESTLQQLKGEGSSKVIVAPFGFLAEHVETLYDLDIEANRWAAELDLGFVRVPTLNTDSAFIECLANLVRRTLD